MYYSPLFPWQNSITRGPIVATIQQLMSSAFVNFQPETLSKDTKWTWLGVDLTSRYVFDMLVSRRSAPVIIK